MNFTSPNTIYPLPKHFSSKGQTFTFFLGGGGGWGGGGIWKKVPATSQAREKVMHGQLTYVMHCFLKGNCLIGRWKNSSMHPPQKSNQYPRVKQLYSI